MILTSKEVLFVKESTGAVVDRLSLSAINFVGRVNLAQTVRRQPIATATVSGRASTKRAFSNLTTSVGSMSGIITRGAPPALADDDAVADSEGSAGVATAAAAAGGRCALEIRTVAGGGARAAGGGGQRSYIARVVTAVERDAWVDAVSAAVRAAAEAARENKSLITWAQVSSACASCVRLPVRAGVCGRVPARVCLPWFATVPYALAVPFGTAPRACPLFRDSSHVRWVPPTPEHNNDKNN
jgi:hypothetical protein